MATDARLVFCNSPAAASWPYPTWVWRVCRANLEQVQLLTQILVTNARRHLNLHSHPLFPCLLACPLPLLTWTLGTALHETTQAKDNCSLVLLHHLQREKRERERKGNREWEKEWERNVSKMCKIKLKFSWQREPATRAADALPLPLPLPLTKRFLSIVANKSARQLSIYLCRLFGELCLVSQIKL